MGGMRTLQVLLENPVPLSELRRYVASAPGYQTLRTWARRGVKIKAGPRSGERFTLDYYHQGGTLMTSVEAYFRFLEAINSESRPRKDDHAEEIARQEVDGSRA